jgi:hypothetical protein
MKNNSLIISGKKYFADIKIRLNSYKNLIITAIDESQNLMTYK